MPGTDAEKRAPPVQWAERRNLLYLFFHVPDSHKPDIQLSTDKLYFRTKSKSGVEYEVTLNFYKEINAESSLVGTAKQIQSADDTYESLFHALKNRFENKRLIVNTHIKSLLMLDNIGVESAEKLRMLLDCILKHVRALKVLNVEMNNFSENLLINIILMKLDKTTCKEFEMSLTSTSTDLPKWDTFIEFMENRVQILENLHGTQVNSQKFKGQIKNKTFVLKSNPCVLCKQSHGLYLCPVFLKMTPIQRFDEVKKNKLCINCFSSAHYHVSKCNSKYNCQICTAKHNVLLHRNQNKTLSDNKISSKKSDSEIDLSSQPSARRLSNEDRPQKYCISDRGVDFILRKVEDGPYWNQLLKDNKKYPWLKIDFTRWRDEDDSDVEMNEEEFEQMMKRMSGLESTSKDLNDLDTETDEEETET